MVDRTDPVIRQAIDLAFLTRGGEGSRRYREELANKKKNAKKMLLPTATD